MEVYLYFTKCADVFQDEFDERLIFFDEDGEISSGFSTVDFKNCTLSYKNNSILVESGFCIENNLFVYLIHDSERISEGYDALWHNLSQASKIVTFFHKNNATNQREDFYDWYNTLENKPELIDNPKTNLTHASEKGFSHEEGLPFYRLIELWECDSNEAFENKLQEFETTFFEPKEYLEKVDEREIKYAIIDNLLGNISVTNEKQKQILTDYDINVENYLKMDDGEAKTKELIGIRDTLFNKI